MDLTKLLGNVNQSFVLASCFWGAVASGYLIYGWRQKTFIPFYGGVAMVIVSLCTGALVMSLASILIMLVVWWLCKQAN